MTIQLTVPPKRELKPRITVMGVGGAGGNAVNNMIKAGLSGVEFVVANTDAQALAGSDAERRIQMGVQLTEGLGAGSDPSIGQAAAEEAMAEIVDQIQGSHMVFITAGMGGGTGTGAAPVIARACREQGILTIGVVTKPFEFEGPRRMQAADLGIAELTSEVDTLIIIPNQNLFRVANEQTGFVEAFAIADEVLHSGVASVTDLMTKPGLINLDFADVKMVMNEMGKAMMGTGEQDGENRAIGAAEAAIANPLLEDDSMQGATGLLISITGGKDMTLYEVDEAANRIKSEVSSNANIIIGAIYDESLAGCIRVSVVATGIESEGAGHSARPGPRLVKLPARETMPDMPPAMPVPSAAQAEARTEVENSTAMPALPDMPNMVSDSMAATESAERTGHQQGAKGEDEMRAENDIPSFLTSMPERPQQRPIPKRNRSFIDRVLRGRDESADVETETPVAPPAEQPMEQPEEPPVVQPAEPPMEQPAEQPAKQVAEQAEEPPVEHVAAQPAAQKAEPQEATPVASPQVAHASVEQQVAPADTAEPPRMASASPNEAQSVSASAPEAQTESAAESAIESETVSEVASSEVASDNQPAPDTQLAQATSDAPDAQAAPMAQTAVQADMSSDMATGGYDNAQLDIPAFLRRQSD